MRLSPWLRWTWLPIVLLAWPTERSLSAEERIAPSARAAILDEPGLPVAGAGSDPAVIAVVLREAGWEVERVSASQLADTQVLSADRFRLLALPYGESFPLPARQALLTFLRGGGSLFTTGGYAFDNLLAREADGWQPYDSILAERTAAARRGEDSLLRAGDFEHAQDVANAWTRLSPDRCALTPDAYQGAAAAQVFVPADQSTDSATWEQSVTPQPGERYLLRARMRTRNVQGLGFAYLAAYQFDASDELITFRDYSQRRGDTEWSLVEHVVGIDARTRRLSIRLGLFQASGTAWFDDVSLAPLPPEEYLNTRWGDPRDGLHVNTDQLGLFDAGFPLARAVQARAGSPLLPADFQLAGPFEGFAAVAPLFERARWTPLINGYDRHGRPRGALGALLYHYDGPFLGSTWAFFGVSNRDLFGLDEPVMRDALRRVFEQMRRNVYLGPPETDRAAYRDGEPIAVSARVVHAGIEPMRVLARFRWEVEQGSPAHQQERSLTLEPGRQSIAEAIWAPTGYDEADFCRITVELVDPATGAVWDRAETGAVLLRPGVVDSCPPLRFHDNYFHFGRRAQFLCGTDTYANMFSSRAENPLRWREDVSACRDFGLNVFENLQFHPKGDWLTPEQERQIEGLIQLCQQFRQAYMAGLWIGANVVVDDRTLARQADYCGQFARRFGHVPALIHYLNGDFVVRFDSEDLARELFGRYLRARYATMEDLQAAWTLNPPEGEFGTIAYNAPPRGWADVRAVDQARFIPWLVQRWVRALTDAVRAADPDHPVTAEYYREPFGGIDLPLSIDGMDVANIGYFDVPDEDLRLFARRFAFTDLRAVGKSLNVGEFGVKTHPAWEVERGGQDYHIVRTEQEQHRLFLGLGHYALGLGGSKIQNWCWKDASERIFPWGLCYPNDLIPKDVAYTYRNLSLLFRQFEPFWEPPAAYLLFPDQHRMGSGGDSIRLAAMNGIQHLIHARVPFAMLHDGILDEIPDAARAIFYPLPYCPDDETVAKLERFVRGGGTLYLSGDLSFDPLRGRTRTDRLERLAGVRFAGEREPAAEAPFLPAARFEPAGAERFEQRDGWILATHRVGAGRVVFTNEPYECRHDADQVPPELYREVLSLAGLPPLRVRPDTNSLHVFRLPTRDGGQVHVFFNAGDEEVEVILEEVDPALRLRLGAKLPALAWLAGDGSLRALEGSGAARRGDRPLVDANGHWMLIALDGPGLPESESLLLIPFDEGDYHLATPLGHAAVEAGEVRGGMWADLTRASSAASDGLLPVTVPADLERDLFLIADPQRLPQLRDRVAGMLRDVGP